MGRVIGIVLAIAVAIGVVSWKMQKQGEASGEMRGRAIAYFEDLPDYATHQAVYVTALDAHHDACFDRHYIMGGKRRSATFDEDQYWTDLLTGMAADLDRQGYTGCASNLRELLELYHASTPASAPAQPAEERP